MRTRRRIYSSNVYQTVNRETKRKRVFTQDQTYQKLLKIGDDGGGLDFFDRLPDDLIISILCKLSAAAGSPSDFVSVLLTCKRMNGLGVHQLVLSKASTRCLAVKAKNWSSSSHRFLKRCADAGNAEALYTLGMTLFYCLQQRGSGISLMAKAAMASHAQALYSLAVIKFNGSGGTKSDKDLHAGVALCARAAFLGHIDALRELGHCLQDGYGVRQNITEGRRFLIEANFREIVSVLRHRRHHHHLRHFFTCKHHHHLLSDFGYNVPIVEAYPVSKFLSDWFLLRSNANDDLRLCSHSGCGRSETRRHEFRRCSVCGIVNYCSRACQALDWKLRHKAGCTSPFHRWIDANEEVILMEVQERRDH